MTRLPRTEPYPPALRQEIRRASRLSHALSLFATRVGPADPCFDWLCGRIDEVRAAVGTTTRDWTEARMDSEASADRLRVRVRELEESLHAFARASFVRGRDAEPPPAAGAPARAQSETS